MEVALHLEIYSLHLINFAEINSYLIYGYYVILLADFNI
jgi:hypothetical protein